MRHVQARVANFTGFFTEDGAQEALFWGQFGLALRADLADQHIARGHIGTHADDAAIVEVRHDVFTQVGNVTGNFFWPELGVARVDFVFLHVN